MDPLGLYIISGRLAPASAFAALVALVVHATARRYGSASGVAAGFSVAAMPRVFAHAHLGALDTFIAAFWVFALLAAERALTSRRPARAMSAAGLAWSLALLTKIHAWFLIPVVFTRAIARLGVAHGARAFAVWLATGLAVFFAGWPWLWYAPVQRLSAYLGTGVARAPISVQYLGRVYLDHDVPWHYPWVYFAVTVPVGLHLLGLVGLRQGMRVPSSRGFTTLLLGSILLFLVLFSTRIPVYDGERLFLVVFPLWAIMIGQGFGHLWERLREGWWRRLALSGFLLAQTYGVVTMHPFGLSYYNALVGGLSGAERLGFEVTFWGDAVDRVLLDALVRAAPADADAALVPTLYPGQGIASTTRTMARRSILLRDEQHAERVRWLVVSRRTAYWRPFVPDRLARGRVVFVRSRQGVWLSAIYEIAD
jgi:4-amino-4-deoxy-L-arabinose transferase-like glycosyltransferase